MEGLPKEVSEAFPGAPVMLGTFAVPTMEILLMIQVQHHRIRVMLPEFLGVWYRGSCRICTITSGDPKCTARPMQAI